MTENILTYNGISIPEEEVYGLPVRLYHHIFYGRVSQNFKIYGIHHQDALTGKADNFEAGDIRIVSGSKIEGENGFYEAAVECWNGKVWISKTSKNGFFPNDWTRKKVMEEIAIAREKIKVDDWQPPVLPQKKSNAYLQVLTCGQLLSFYLGSPKKNKPTKLDSYLVTTFPYFETGIV